MQDSSLSGARLEGCVLTGTFNAITAVAISPDGQSWAAAGRHGEVRVWELEQAVGPSLHRVWPAHTETTYALAFSPDGRLLASGSWDDTLKLWDVESGALLWSSWHPKSIHSLAFAPDGRLLATGGSDGMLRWWQVESGECVRVRQAHAGTIRSLKSSHDGKRLAICGDDGAIHIWDLERGEHLRTLRRDRPYERLDISGVQGLTEAQKASLRALGAVEERGAHLTTEQAIVISPGQERTFNP
jgi:WD40 repeat protein